MLELREIEFSDEGMIVAMKGTFKPSKVFSIITDKVIFWAELGLEYVGG